MSQGKFITLEGVDGAGKSTHTDWIGETLRSAGKDVVVTREPGGTPLGEKLRSLLLGESMDIETETLLMFAARREHIVQVILPALAAGRWVLSDRFTDATFAYQGGGGGIPSERIAQLEAWVHKGLQPDLTLVFDVPIELARRRLATAAKPDRFERQDVGFFNRVREAYLRRAKADPKRIKIIDSSKSLSEVRAYLKEIISSICK